MLVENLQTFLANSATITALLGTPATRSDSLNGLFYEQAPDVSGLAMPYVVYEQADGSALDETMAGTGLLRTAHWTFECFGSTAKQAKKLAMALKTALLPNNSVLTTQGIWLRREADDTVQMAKGVLFTTKLTFLVLFTESV